jgi:predicted 3-demethylubiquinone-9 3-methyltransferase (glyoxalase superfamily)
LRYTGEIDYYWNALTKDGAESMCGWLKDKYGISWQVIPSALEKLMNDPEKAARVMKEVMTMKKLDIEKLMNTYKKRPVRCYSLTGL